MAQSDKKNNWIESSENISIQRLDILNSDYRETNISITPDGKHLYFMSDRGEQTWSTEFLMYKGKLRYDGDIWYSTGEKDNFRKPICLDNNVNTYSGEDEPIVSQDGQFVTFQSWKSDWGETDGPYYYAELSGKHFLDPIGLGDGITAFFLDEFNKYNGTYATDGASLSPDGKIFLVCSGAEYDGKMDIYISRKINGKWSYMKKAAISTTEDERSIFIAGDGKTIYFGSNGYKTSKGLDIYKTILHDDNTFDSPIKLAEPFNTSKDDYGFITTASGNESYFVRDGDIYYANTTNLNDKIKPKKTKIISGIIKDEKGIPMELYLTLKDAALDKIISSSKSNSQTGKFLFSISNNVENFRIVDEKEGLLDTSFKILKKDNSNNFKMNIKIKAHKEYTHKKVKSNKLELTINYMNNDYTIDKQYEASLSNIANKLISNPEIKLQIHSHASSPATEKYNIYISNKRKEFMINYFVKRGIKINRIIARAYGESNLINHCKNGIFCNDKYHKENRRTELKLIYNK